MASCSATTNAGQPAQAVQHAHDPTADPRSQQRAAGHHRSVPVGRSLGREPLCRTARRLRHDGNTCGHGLEHDHGETLEAARVHKDVKGVEKLPSFRGRRMESNDVVESQLRHQTPKIGLLRTISNDHAGHVGMRMSNDRRRTDQDVDALRSNGHIKMPYSGAPSDTPKRRRVEAARLASAIGRATPSLAMAMRSRLNPISVAATRTSCSDTNKTRSDQATYAFDPVVERPNRSSVVVVERQAVFGVDDNRCASEHGSYTAQRGLRHVGVDDVEAPRSVQAQQGGECERIARGATARPSSGTRWSRSASSADASRSSTRDMPSRVPAMRCISNELASASAAHRMAEP